MKVKVLCKHIVHGSVFGKKDDIVELPDNVAEALIKDKKAEAIVDPKAKSTK